MPAIAVILLAATMGSYLGIKLKMPAGAMVGALLAAAVASNFFAAGILPGGIRFLAQAVAGLAIGAKIKKSDIIELRRIFWAAAMAVGIMLGVGVLIAIAISSLTGQDLTTSLFSSAPGGIVDMSLMSSSMGAEVTIVSVMQLVRLTSIIVFFPLLHKKLFRYEPESVERIGRKKGNREQNRVRAAVSFGIAALFGMIGNISGVPAGTLIFAMAGTALYNVLSSRATVTPVMAFSAKMLAGAYIGSSITVAALITLKSFVVPALIMVAAYFVMSSLIALWLKRKFGLEFMTAFFSCTPGGMSDISLIAMDYGANLPVITAVQMFRVVSVVVLYPVIIKLLSGI